MKNLQYISVLLLQGSILAFSTVLSTASLAEEHEKAPLYPPAIANPAKVTPPQTPELLEPAFMAKVTAATTLKWKAVANATNYHLQVATDPNFKWLVVNEVDFKATSFELKGLESSKHYYWRIFAQNGNNDPGNTKSFAAKSMFFTN